MDVPITCVLTRFGLRSAKHLRPSLREYRRLVAAVPETAGLLKAAFLVEDKTAWYSLSIWSGTRPLMSATVPEHIEAARRVFGRLEYDPDRGPELWSTQWRLARVSNNLNWGDFDLRSLVTREEVA